MDRINLKPVRNELVKHFIKTYGIRDGVVWNDSLSRFEAVGDSHESGMNAIRSNQQFGWYEAGFACALVTNAKIVMEEK